MNIRQQKSKRKEKTKRKALHLWCCCRDQQFYSRNKNVPFPLPFSLLLTNIYNKEKRVLLLIGKQHLIPNQFMLPKAKDWNLHPLAKIQLEIKWEQETSLSAGILHFWTWVLNSGAPMLNWFIVFWKFASFLPLFDPLFYN